MTCIAAISDGTRVWMGGDSALSTGDSVWVTSDPKVYSRPPLVVGFCGSLRFRSLVAMAPLPPIRQNQDLDLWVRQDYCAALRQAASNVGFKLGGGDEEDDSEAIIGLGGTIYVIDAGAEAYRPASHYAAIGGGAAWAEGSLFSSKGRPVKRLTAALEAAEHHCPGVRKPWAFVNT